MLIITYLNTVVFDIRMKHKLSQSQDLPATLCANSTTASHFKRLSRIQKLIRILCVFNSAINEGMSNGIIHEQGENTSQILESFTYIDRGSTSICQFNWPVNS